MTLMVNPYELALTVMLPTITCLADKMRYSTHLSEHTDHWVPYIILYEDGDSYTNRLLNILNSDETQTTLSPDHFQWKDMGVYQRKGNKLGALADKTFPSYCKLGMYWYHIVTTPVGTEDLGYML